MSALHENIFILIKHFENRQAKSLFAFIQHQFQSIRDSNNSTLLHASANNNNFQMAEYLLNQYKILIEQQPLKYSLQTKIKWLCTKDNEGFSCLHYAVFRNNYKLVRLFEENGSDIYQINNQGLTVLHIAAQGNSPLLIYYFLSKGLKISVLDSKGNTPLHWACYSGMQSSSSALISWGAQIDKKDETFGMTPLHLAVLSGNGRIVRKLLIKGCDRKIQNYNKKLPLQLAQQSKFKNIQQMILDKRGITQLCNLKTPYRKVTRINPSFFISIFVFLSCYILNTTSFVLCKNSISARCLYISFLVFGFLQAALYTYLYLSNPGNVGDPLNPHRNMFQLLMKYEPNKICFDCGIVRPDRSKHCDICSCCVSVFDHHCPWIANCIGCNNYLMFYIFLVLMIILIVDMLVLQIVVLVEHDWKNSDQYQTIKIFTSVYSLVISIVFLFPVAILIYIQTKNVCTNVTTFERHSKSKQNKKQGRLSVLREPVKETRLSEQLVENKNRNKKQSNIQLTDFSVDNSPSMSVQRNTALLQIQRSSSQDISSTYLNNCYRMCWGNRNIMNYRVAV